MGDTHELKQQIPIFSAFPTSLNFASILKYLTTGDGHVTGTKA